MADSNRTVLITGAAQGLGRAMSLGLLEQGFSVAAVDRDSTGIAALREQFAAGHHDLKAGPWMPVSATSRLARDDADMNAAPVRRSNSQRFLEK